ncbi:MAG: hypothetical protein KJI72_00615 [Patescibacteria group bacterium]|nr:hypothetical protein [Patescibacteria group bacterium]
MTTKINSADKYIIPITKIYSIFAEAKEFYDKFQGVSIFDDEERLGIVDIIKGQRTLIVGEPGVGKSMLLGKIKDQLDTDGCVTELVGLRQPNAMDRIDIFVTTETEAPKALLLDALDEVQSSLFPAVLQKIEEVSTRYPNLPIFLSSRWIFINQHATSFPNYRFITISPFTQGQVREYLRAAKHSDSDIDALLGRIMPFSHRMLVIQIPRYLSYLEKFLEEKGIPAAAEVSRNKLFEYFIYSKLELEDKKLNADKRAIIKRVLEKLALTMEIYQTNVISKDELMTFFDEIKSDLKLVALTQIELEIFFDKSLLKNNVDTVEFDNTEFQEYLAAKEISRFPDPNRAAAGFAIDPDAKEMYPTWFNALTFLVDMRPDLLGQLVDFSGLRGTQFKLIDEGFLVFLSRVDPRNVPLELRRQIFILAMDYHQRTLQWLPGQLTSALPSFFDNTLEGKLKAGITKADKEKNAARFVPLGNIVYVIAYLFRRGVSLDRSYWRGKLIEYAGDKNENGVLQRHALLALTWLRDPSVIDELPNLMESDELVRREFLDMCVELNPENPKSLGYFFEAIRRNEFHGRYGIFALKKRASIESFLKTYNVDENFRREFINDTRIFQDEDHVLVEHIEAVLDDEIKKLCKETLVRSVNYNIAHDAEHSTFIVGLWKLLRRGDPNFVTEMVERIKKSEDGKTGLYFAHRFFAEVIEKEDVPRYIEVMIAMGEKDSAASVMSRMKFSKREGANEIYEAGRSLLSEEYKQWEEARAKPDTHTEMQNEKLLQQFRTLLEPNPGKFSNSVFEFYNKNIKCLEPLVSTDEKKRLAELITGTIFKFVDPVKHDLTITAQHDGSKTYTTSSSVFVFGDALVTAKHLEIDITPFRQNILNFIPFAYNDELKTIFELVKDIKPGEMEGVLKVYKSRKSDLWQHMTSSFVEAVEQYHVVEAIPILKGFIKESALDRYTREQSLTVVGTLSSDPTFLKEIFNLYKESKNEDEKKLAYIANGLLITSQGDAEAIKWRLREVVQRAAAFIRLPGMHKVNSLEEEIEHSKSFAKPLMDLKHHGYEPDYLKLLEEAMGVFARSKEFQAYAEYLWSIVYAYFDNLKDERVYDPLRQLERKIAEMKDRDGANWLASRMINLRRSYLGYLGKPRNISEAIKKYNDARAYDDKKILTSTDLFRQLQDALETDLRRWIEGEGAYDLILGEKVYDAKQQAYEKLIQKTLKSKIEQIMLKRGFEVDVDREVELLDGKKVDFLVRYGFVGPIVVETKLTSSTDLKGTKIDRSPSYVSMSRYIYGFGASHGILLVVDNDKAKNLSEVKEIFQRIPNVSVHSFDCYSRINPVPKERIIAFDFDGTIAKYTGFVSPDDIKEPIQEVVETIKTLRERGYRILIHSTRGNEFLEKYCKKFSIPFDFINHNLELQGKNPGKPIAYVYVDDRAIQYNGQSAKELVSEIENFKVYWRK